MYSYLVVFETERDDKIIEESEWIVATNIDDVFALAKRQDDENHELIAIVRRNPIVSVLDKQKSEIRR